MIPNMKRAMLLTAALFTATWLSHARAWAQGAIAFDNINRPLIDAPVYDIDCRTGLEGDAYLAQVYGGLSADKLQPLEPIVGFRSGRGAGYMAGLVTPQIPGALEGDTVYAQLRAWEATAGASYEEAVATGGKHGRSNIVPMIAHQAPAGRSIGIACRFGELLPRA
jgi:hypothetical protein